MPVATSGPLAAFAGGNSSSNPRECILEQQHNDDDDSSSLQEPLLSQVEEDENEDEEEDDDDVVVVVSATTTMRNVLWKYVLLRSTGEAMWYSSILTVYVELLARTAASAPAGLVGYFSAWEGLMHGLVEAWIRQRFGSDGDDEEDEEESCQLENTPDSRDEEGTTAMATSGGSDRLFSTWRPQHVASFVGVLASGVTLVASVWELVSSVSSNNSSTNGSAWDTVSWIVYVVFLGLAVPLWALLDGLSLPLLWIEDQETETDNGPSSPSNASSSWSMTTSTAALVGSLVGPLLSLGVWYGSDWALPNVINGENQPADRAVWTLQGCASVLVAAQVVLLFALFVLSGGCTWLCCCLGWTTPGNAHSTNNSYNPPNNANDEEEADDEGDDEEQFDDDYFEEGDDEGEEDHHHHLRLAMVCSSWWSHMFSAAASGLAIRYGTIFLVWHVMLVPWQVLVMDWGSVVVERLVLGRLLLMGRSVDDIAMATGRLLLMQLVGVLAMAGLLFLAAETASEYPRRDRATLLRIVVLYIIQSACLGTGMRQAWTQALVPDDDEEDDEEENDDEMEDSRGGRMVRRCCPSGGSRPLCCSWSLWDTAGTMAWSVSAALGGWAVSENDDESTTHDETVVPFLLEVACGLHMLSLLPWLVMMVWGWCHR